MDEAKLLMQNRQLLAQLNPAQGLAFAQGQKVMPPGVNAGPGYFNGKPQAALNGNPNLFASNGMPTPSNGFPGIHVPPYSNGRGIASGGNQAAQMQQLMMQTQLQNQQTLASGFNANAYAANPSAAIQARNAAQQVAQSFLEQQAVVQMQQRQTMAAVQQQATAAQNAQQNSAWINAALQRALANSQIVIQNGVPVLIPNGNGVTQNNGQQSQLAAAQMIQQLQAAAVAQQKHTQHAQQVQVVKQIQAVLAQQAKANMGGNNGMGNGPTPQANMLKQAQLQEALAALNGRTMPAVPGQVPKPNGLANNPPNQQAHVQVNQAQAQQRIRHYLASVANLTPTQLQALGANPALAQALLQARQAAGAGQVSGASVGLNVAIPGVNRAPANPLLPQQPSQHVTSPVAIPGADPLLMPTLSSSAASSEILSPTSSVSGSPPTSMSKEQRHMALACVALQLAHSGISVDQAIHSGIMGGISVTEVRFIVEVYNAEQARMKEQGGGGGVPDGKTNPPFGNNGSAMAQAAAQPQQQVGSQAGSPNQTHPPSVANSVAGSTHDTGSVNGNPGDAAALFEADAFNAFSYGFFGNGVTGSELEGELEGGLLEAGSADGGVPAWAEDGSLEGDLGSLESPTKGGDDVAARLANLDLGSGFF